MSAVSIRTLDGPSAAEAVPHLADVLIDSVEGGASVGFLAPLDRARAEGFWRGIAASVAAERRVLIVAEEAGAVLGTAVLSLAQAENQPHRADLGKVLVRRSARCRGIGARLMAAAEAEARDRGRTLLVLDTATPEAERLYERTGWTRAGTVPRFALMPDGAPCATTFFYKSLA